MKKQSSWENYELKADKKIRAGEELREGGSGQVCGELTEGHVHGPQLGQEQSQQQPLTWA